MKPMARIAIALCALLLTTVGGAVATAKQDGKSGQAGKSSIYFYDVASIDGSGSGRLRIDLDRHTFVFNGKGFEPSETYYLFYTIGEAPGTHRFAKATATQTGAVFLRGIWTDDITSFPAVPTFSITPPLASGTTLYAELHLAHVTPIYQNGIRYTAFYFWANGSTAVVGVGYRLAVDITYGGAEQSITVYDGPSITLNDAYGEIYSDPVLVRDGAQSVATLTVYDLAGNSGQVSINDLFNAAG